ncbi:MAG TPA: ATP synthase F1 subunit epsilon [Myxococcales bacterium LLY-WYZ-16_1]|nr:ATP synthase F1 subunit epsilon [Myxococcales bacterium LLY-WYZ-16_1]
MALEVDIVTPDQAAVQVSCDEVVVPGLEGDIGLLPGHVPLLSALRPGVLSVRKEGKRTFYAVGAGFVQIEDDRVQVLTEACDTPARIDLEATKRSLADAEGHLKDLGPGDPRFFEFERSAALARARIDAKSR